MGSWGELGVNWTDSDSLRGSRGAYVEVARCHRERGWGQDADPVEYDNGLRPEVGYQLNLYARDAAITGIWDDYYNHTLDTDVIFYLSGGTYHPYVWDETAYLTASGDSEWLSESYSGQYRGAPHRMDKLIQWRKALNLMRWGLAAGGKTFRYAGSGSDEVKFDHPAPQMLAPYTYDTALFPPHQWEIWVSVKAPGHSYDAPVKVHSELIATSMEEGGTKDTGWLLVSGLGLSWKWEYFWLYSDYIFHVMKFDVSGGFGYKDW